jgi:hypothetical protein
MLGSDRLYLAFALVTAVAVGCGGGGETMSTSSSGGQGGGTSSSSTSSSTTTTTTGEGGGASCPTMEGTVFAVKKLYFGEGTSGEWKKVGFNLDGKVSTGVSKDLCQPNAGGAPQTAYPDGDQGIDNSFGKNLLPTILAAYPTWVSDIDKGIQAGNFTALLKVLCLPPTGDAPALITKLFGGTSLGMPPKFDGTDTWPVEPGLLSDPMNPESSTIVFPASSVLGATFDAGKNGTVILSVPVRTTTKSTSIKLTLYAARLTMTLAADRKSATAGMIGGVLDTEEFVAEIQKLGYLLGLCGNALFNNLVTQVRQASDIMTDGSQDPSKTCNGISMGLGFEMQQAQLGKVGVANPVGTGCPMMAR